MTQSIVIRTIYFAYIDSKVAYHIAKSKVRSIQTFKASLDKQRVYYALADLTQEQEGIVATYWILSPERTLRYKLLKSSGRGTPKVIQTAYGKLIHRIEHLEPDVIHNLIGREFKIPQLYQLFTLARPEQERSNFYRFLKKADLLKSTGKILKNSTGRPAQLYGLKKRKGNTLYILY